MSDKKIDETIFGQTPLPPDFYKDLIPQDIMLLDELNQYESRNITKAVAKYLHGSKTNWDLTDYAVILRLHKDMFDEVWRWAGKTRTKELNIGVQPAQIWEELKRLTDDLKYWLANKTFPPHETALRFHHRLVSIHPFANGNGRCSRLCADVLMMSLAEPPLNWGSLGEDTAHRGQYIEALRSADQSDYSKLLKLFSD